MGSVKEIKISEQASETKEGTGEFEFSDRYSVFDWGEMPDHIEKKGAALCVLSAYFFDILEKNNIKTHFLGLFDEGGWKKFPEIKKPSNRMKVRLVRVLKPGYDKNSGTYDYSAYKNAGKNFLIPLEVIYRNKLPKGSSVFKRLKSGAITYKDLGLGHEPAPGEKLDKPILDVSTKLEHIDRYISWEEAKNISGLPEEKMSAIKSMILEINNIITKECSRAGIENVDGKFEFAIDPQGDIMVVDVLGTPDECRFLFEGFHISKEITRRWYRDTEWAAEAEKAKKEHAGDWKQHVKAAPPALPPEMKQKISEMYMAVANSITGKTLFSVPSLDSIIGKLKKYDT